MRPATAGEEPSRRPSGGDTLPKLSPVAMETNDLGFVASLLFVLVPAVFLIVLYIQTNSRQA
jgi:photosystem II PsbM protein